MGSDPRSCSRNERIETSDVVATQRGLSRFIYYHYLLCSLLRVLSSPVEAFIIVLVDVFDGAFACRFVACYVFWACREI